MVPTLLKLDNKGLTFVEIMTVIIIIAAIALFALPQYVDFQPKARLKGASNQLVSDMQNAKITAVKDNAQMLLTVATAAPCATGSYVFTNGISDDIGLCIDDEYADVFISGTTFNGGDGFTTRGLSVLTEAGAAGGGSITLESSRLQDTGDPTYVITMSGSGGVQVDRIVKP